MGSVIKRKTRSAAVYQVQNVKDLKNVIIPHFNKYPLITQKKADFILFSLIIELILSNKHLEIEGLNEIVNIRASMNNGLSEKLKLAFPKFEPLERPLILNENIPDPN